jgi:hypothetical protein
MTWIVGTGTMFGHAVLASDIRATVKYSTGEESHIDCLQKVHPLGKFVVGGFAGSVKIGFAIIDQIQAELAVVDEGNVWSLDIIANTWLPRVVRKIFNSFPLSEKILKSQIILASTHPTINWPFPNTSLPVLYKLESPDFEPQKAAQDEVLGIGNGAIVDCMIEVNEICKKPFFHETILGGVQYQAMYVANILEGVIKKIPLPGVSNLFQFATVNRKQIEIFNHERSLCTAEGNKPILKFPPVLAKSFEQLKRMVVKSGVNLECATC